jgi:hypothetical protein
MGLVRRDIPFQPSYQEWGAFGYLNIWVDRDNYLDFPVSISTVCELLNGQSA